MARRLTPRQQEYLGQVQAWAKEADELTRDTRPPRGRRLKCYVLTLRARAEYFNGRYRRAERSLDEAHAVLPRAIGVKGHTAAGVTYLHQAENAILYSQTLRPSRKLRRSPDTSVAMLDRAAIYLGQAAERLQLGKRDNYWWPRFYILNATLQLERLLLAADFEDSPAARRHALDGCAREALASLRAARMSIYRRGEGHRFQVIKRLYEQLKQVWLELRDSDHAQQEWSTLNESAGLEPSTILGIPVPLETNKLGMVFVGEDVPKPKDPFCGQPLVPNQKSHRRGAKSQTSKRRSSTPPSKRKRRRGMP